MMNSMGNINILRVILGGLLAGIVIVVGELILNGVILGEQFIANRHKLGLEDPSTLELTIGAILTLLYGVILIWIYAAIRPRFGAGPKTAFIAAITFWAIAYVLFLFSLWANGLVPLDFAIISILWGLVEAPIAALVGASLYKE